jgi:hypothetical protein
VSYAERLAERAKKNGAREAQLQFLRNFIKTLHVGPCPNFEAELRKELEPYFGDENIAPLKQDFRLQARLNELVAEGLLSANWNGFRWLWKVK